MYGLNPGLIPTNIRANVFGEGTWLQRAAERALGWVNPTAEGYAEAILPTLTAPELDAHTGVHFNQRGAPILGSDGMDDARVARFIAAADAAIRQALAPPPDAG